MALAIVIAGLAISRSVGMTMVWSKWERQINPIVEDLAVLPEGVMVFKAFARPVASFDAELDHGAGCLDTFG